jgi:MFS_1 like family
MLYMGLLLIFVTGMRCSFFLMEAIVAVMERYERNRFICTVMFGAAAFAGGSLLEGGHDLQGPMIAIMIASGFMAWLVREKAPDKTIQSKSQDKTPARRDLLWTMIPVMAGVFIIGLAIMGSEIFFSLLMENAGHDGGGIGAFWATEITTEALAFMCAGHIGRHIGAHNLVRVTIALLPLRYALLIRSNGTESILLSQAVAGVCFAWYLVGITNMTKKNVPTGREQQALALVVGTGLGAASVGAGAAGSLIIAFGGM